MSDSYNLKITDFLARFRANKKIDDLFSRGYTLGMDSETSKRIILKLYSIQTPEQEQAVLENLQNFAKLNQVNGISKFLSFAIAENNNELMSAFEYDPMTLGEFTQVIKQSTLTKPERFMIYWQILAHISKIINTSTQIGIQLDDINRETVLIQQNNVYPQSSSSLMELEHYAVRFFYDERQKQYTKVQNNILTLQNNNKLYWSPEKIQTQILRNSDYSMQEGEQSIYQLGLMILDIVYQIQKYAEKNSIQSDHQRRQQQLKPDQEVLHSESMMSYYQIDKNRKIAQRNQPLVTQRLNYLISLDGDCYKQLGLLLKNMTMLMSQARPSVEKIQSERIKMASILSQSLPKKPVPLSNSPKIQNSNNIASFRSLQSISEEPIQSSIGQTIKNIQYSKNNLSSAEINYNLIQDVDSLKYSENSLGNNISNQGFYLTNQFVKKNNYHAIQNGSQNGSPSPIEYIKEVGNQKSATTVTSEVLANKLMGVNWYETTKIAHYQQSSPSNNDSIKNQSPILSSNVKNTISFEEKQARFIKTEQLLEHCKTHHESLKASLISAIKQLEQIRRMYTEKVLKKQYFDGSVYYGCFDSITKKKKGLGIYVYNTGDIYFGNWDQNLLINGTYLFKNGQSFQGVVKAGKQGLGIYRYSNGNVYQGMWKDDLKNGKGVMTYPNGAKYDGQWMKGKKHGQGIYYYQNGTKYKGGFALGKKYGNGIFIFSNGTKIQGFWDNNHLEGLAKIYYQNGDYYEGNFHMSQKSGQGVYKWNNQQEGQIQYKGSFKKDNLDGFAIIKFSNGEIYQGKIKNGKRDGQGIYKYSNGDQFKGEWKNDQKQIGKYIFSTGDHFQGRFKQGQMSFGLMKYLNGETYQGQFYRGERHGVGAYSSKAGQLAYEGYWQKDEYKGNKKN